MTNVVVAFRGPNGEMIALEAVDTGVSDGRGNQIYRLGVDSAVSIDPGTITIGAVKIQDAGGLTQAAVKTVTSISEGDAALAVQAPILGELADAADLVGTTTTLNAKIRGLIQLLVAKLFVKIADGDAATLGITTGAAVITDANGSVQQYLRGLVKLFAPALPAARGQTVMAGSWPVVLASNQSPLSVVSVDDTQVLEPVDQVSSAVYVDFAGSSIDTRYNSNLSYTLLNKDGANGLTWQILAANKSDYSDAYVQTAGASIAAGAVGHVNIDPASNRYYKVQIKDTIGAAHAAGQLVAIGKIG